MAGPSKDYSLVFEQLSHFLLQERLVHEQDALLSCRNVSCPSELFSFTVLPIRAFPFHRHFLHVNGSFLPRSKFHVPPSTFPSTSIFYHNLKRLQPTITSSMNTYSSRVVQLRTELQSIQERQMTLEQTKLQLKLLKLQQQLKVAKEIDICYRAMSRIPSGEKDGV
jgi:hypothetical protein